MIEIHYLLIYLIVCLQIDILGIADIAHQLLFNKPLEIQFENGEWKLVNSFKKCVYSLLPNYICKLKQKKN